MSRTTGLALVSLVLAVSLSAAPALAADNATVTLKSNSHSKEFLDVSGSMLVWTDRAVPGAMDTSIYGHDIATGRESELVTAAGGQPWPRIAGNVLVWKQESPGDPFGATGHIWGLDIATSTKFPICTVPGRQERPATDGDFVVWQDDRNTGPSDTDNIDIYGYDLATHTETAVCTDPGGQYDPQVSGDYVVWTENVSGGSTARIRCKNIRTGEVFTVCTEPAAQNPSVGNGVVVWQDARVRGDSFDVYGYDLATRRQFPVATTSADEGAPYVSGNVVVYLKSAAGGLNAIGGYDLVSRSSFSINPGVMIGGFAGLSDGNIAWIGWDTGYPIRIMHTTQVSEVQGPDRYETAAKTSQAAFPAGASTVVLATGQQWPDAVGGSALAGRLHAPLLLTPGGSLSSAALGEIERLKATRVIVLGGPSAVSTAVADQIESRLGTGSVSRIGGGDRYYTAEAVASETVSLSSAYDGTALFVTGRDFPDALGVAPLGVAKGWPLFLVDSSGLLPHTQAGMKACGVKRAIIIGSDAAVSAAVESRLRSALGSANVQRLSGVDRYATADRVASFAIGNRLLHWDGLAIATGETFPDGLTGGVLQGMRGAPLLLTHSRALSGDTSLTLKAKYKLVHSFSYIGSSASVALPVRVTVRNILH